MGRRNVTARLAARRDLTEDSFSLRLRLEGAFDRPIPGQFVMIRPAGGSQPFWRRAFSVAGFETDGAGGWLDLMVKIVGPATQAWHELPLHTPVEVLGPLGAGYPVDQAHGRLALIAGGIGLPPLVYAIPGLARRGVRWDLYLGAATASRLVGLEECSRLADTSGGRIIIATDDGSAGERGLIPVVLERRIDAGELYDSLWSCGPMAMLRAVAEVARRRHIEAQLALEERMACGLGVCLGCVVPAAGGGHLRVCREGPVIDASRIDWSRM
ncbi:MAG: dihydroorotate dehydrogenase electron transfer subunit [Acidobacteria bacterium]|nr:dihydroorotate dehydrogenase electron transfer subunit [Acidobacteriota bacterium]